MALHNHVCKKEVSISKVGFSEEPVPGYYPLMCSLIGRFFKKGHFPSPGLTRNKEKKAAPSERETLVDVKHLEEKITGCSGDGRPANSAKSK